MHRLRNKQIKKITRGLFVFLCGIVLLTSSLAIASQPENHEYEQQMSDKLQFVAGHDYLGFPSANDKLKHVEHFLDRDGEYHLSPSDDAFLEDLSRRMFQYFWEQADPKTGLVLDRAKVDGTQIDERHRDVASIAATGFGLTALCIASERHWITSDQAKERTIATLRFFADSAVQEHGSVLSLAEC